MICKYYFVVSILLYFVLNDMFVTPQTTTEQVCNSHNYDPSACPAGCFFKPPNNCTQCPIGTHNEVVGGTCHRCEPKQYGDTPGLATCHRCKQGYYCTGGSDNIPCPLGRYGHYDDALPSFDTLRTACPELCPAGSYGKKIGQYFAKEACSLPNTCAKGCYCPEGSSNPCPKICPPGKYGDENGLKGFKGCKVCDPGFICPGKNNKTKCAAGRFGNVRNASSASIGCSGKCPLGKYGPEAGHQFEYSACKFCAAGWYPKSGAQPGAATLKDACDKCKAGSYKEYVGNDPCKLCPLGYYGDIGDAKKNITPAIGKTKMSEACVNQCPPGTHGKSLGQYNVESGCALCQEGKYTEAYHRKVCERCSSGKYSKEIPGGKSEKEACSASCMIGYYCPGNGKKIECPPGKFGFAEDKIRMQDACLTCNEAVSTNKTTE
jgi:hypothetical protein